MECSSPNGMLVNHKKKESSADTCHNMYFGNVILSERNQTKKIIYVWFHLYEMSENAHL